MTSFVAGSHNIFFRLHDTPDKWASDLEKSHTFASVRGLQEAGGSQAREAIRAHAKKFKLGLYHPLDVADPILWDKTVFSRVLFERGSVKVHEAAPFMRYNPERHFVWRGLKHRESGKRILFVNLHATAGYAQNENDTPWGDKADKWKNETAAKMWKSLAEFLRKQNARKTWDAIVIVGDFNARLTNRDEPYFPGPMLDELCVFDDAPRNIDHLIYTRSSKVRQTRRFAVSKGVHSDHALHFAEFTFKR